VEKPRFFGCLETYRKYAGRNGFYIEFAAAGPLPNGRGSDPSRDRQGAVGTIYGTIGGEAYILTLDPPADRARFETQAAAIEIHLSDNQALSWKPKAGAAPPGVIDMLPYLKLKLLAESVGDPRHVHFANVAGLQEVIGESAL
jgi:hypothetical protein